MLARTLASVTTVMVCYTTPILALEIKIASWNIQKLSKTKVEIGACKDIKKHVDNDTIGKMVADMSGTVFLRIGTATADLAGNNIDEAATYSPPFATLPEPTEPVEEPATAEQPTEPEEPITPEETYRVHYEQYGFSEETLGRLVQYHIEARKLRDAYDRGEISAQEVIARNEAYYEEVFGISSLSARLLRDVYMQERPEGEKLADAVTIGIAYLIVKETHPDATEEEFEELFREVAREVTIVVYID